MHRALIRRGRRWLYVTHRWIGIATCLLFAMWFVSGIVMMYVAFPQFTDRERWGALPEIAWDHVRVAPDRAMAIAGIAHYPRDLRLVMLDDRPVYCLLDWNGTRKTISAADGRQIETIAPAEALAIASHHPNATHPQMIGTILRDQWSVTARYDPLRPLLLVSLGDAAGTELYLSARTGELALDTTRRERFWNWLGAIPHWIYPTVLRRDGATWRQVVLWISGTCLIVAVTGFWIGVLRVRLRPRYARGTVTPYRGWMAWHHIAGLIGGLFVLTWMFSGWLSLNPGEYVSARGPTQDMAVRYAAHDLPQIAATFSSMLPGAVEARFVWLGGRPLMVLTDRDGRETTADPASGAAMTLSDEEIFAATSRLLPNAQMTARLRLEQFDAYWYPHHSERVLPVLRVGFDDAAESWFYIDPRNGDILARIDKSRRTYRWLFNALHSFDFPLLLRYRPAWDIVTVLLSLIGTVVSTSGVVIAWRRLRWRSRWSDARN
ncbi:PepSY domain-containing protein (plasmid) [Bradyrhizobium sp. ISRA443]|uniref:PepSY domain-containing protein n=1 Tax=unclassified Bradyrhizobium TaxID=2631580 RepID=UPI00247B1A26|nr:MULTISPECIES: PepSY domain-containing protein [unclassified Bradyrhizobium]WGR90698.1 PepSY domain-containing protein [Bradyrhizobium sp. ISRA435]WGS03184.1 PepSY domain-containing protein [Bradyrhizobium sp. ISRA436]WGS10022.1 PepSY domain-containing protein [Bradyrhizobium sp. ISRA437]WGS16907.1 PepSY domain-containing protein [Bradyrhizobium sp. ISRA443]